jgi:exodeoxyribonuclease VII large subunit
MEYLEIYQLSELIKDCLPSKKIRVIGEISNPKKSHGNLYFTLKDKTASIKTIIFKKRLDLIKQEIKEGDKIVVKGRLNYWDKTGNLSLIVIKIVKYMGLGNLHKIYEENKLQFEKKGYFLDIHKLKTPQIIKNILIITSKNGAALQDFLFTLKNNKSKLIYDIIDVQVQGKKCSKNIILELNKISIKYDLIVITRGGGSFEDLFEFNNVKLIDTVFKFKQPVLSAIGHQVDEVLLDLVADIRTPTPSLASQYIIDHNNKYIRNKKEILNNIYREMNYKLNKKNKKIRKYYDKLNDTKKIIMRSLQRIKDNYLRLIINFPNSKLRKINNLYNIFYKQSRIFLNIKFSYKDKIKNELEDYLNKLDILKKSINIKQDISLHSNGKEILTPFKLNKKISKKKDIKLIWDNFEYNATLMINNVIVNSQVQ